MEATYSSLTFLVQPTLPSGLRLDASTGRLTGSPEETADARAYMITAANSTGEASVEVTFACVQRRPAATRASIAKLKHVDSPKPAEDAPLQNGASSEQPAPDFGKEIDNIADVANLPPEPDKDTRLLDWMLWTVHRVYLDDPELTTLSLKGLDMPLAETEPRIAPKLMRALGMNRHVASVDLSDSNLRAEEGLALAEALRTNETVQVLNIECNHLDAEALQAVAEALGDHTTSKISTLICNFQQSLGTHFGKAVEQSFAIMMERNLKIKRLSVPCEDVHWKSVIDRCLKRNNDSERRRLKRSKSAREDDTVGINMRTVVALRLSGVPHKPVHDCFRGMDEKLSLVRAFTEDKSRMPTKEQLQLFAKNRGQPLKYSEVAPLSKNFRRLLIDAAVDCQVVATDATQKKCTGDLKSWEEKNEHWRLDVLREDGIKFRFTSLKEVTLEVSPAFAAWLKAPSSRE